MYAVPSYYIPDTQFYTVANKKISFQFTKNTAQVWWNYKHYIEVGSRWASDAYSDYFKTFVMQILVLNML